MDDAWLSEALWCKTTMDVEVEVNSPTSGQPSLQFARLNDKRLRDVAGAIHYFDGRVLLAETMQKDPRRRVGIGMRVSEAAVTPFRR
jgi:hypothetical protein